MTTKPKVTVYRTAYCPFCIQAVRFLRELGVEFEEVSLDDHPDRRAFTSSILPGHTTVPLVVVGDRPLGGLDDLHALHRRGALLSALSG
ncbi:MAG: glutaredoxin 3 [Planctomycetes bacterium]|nr:glutaredoxin 3 [Planctomycetota bacterium]MCB9869717.1 glutaredoxin 3 [Planctomycetota bacterium]